MDNKIELNPKIELAINPEELVEITLRMVDFCTSLSKNNTIDPNIKYTATDLLMDYQNKIIKQIKVVAK